MGGRQPEDKPKIRPVLEMGATVETRKKRVEGIHPEKLVAGI